MIMVWLERTWLLSFCRDDPKQVGICCLCRVSCRVQIKSCAIIFKCLHT